MIRESRASAPLPAAGYSPIVPGSVNLGTAEVVVANVDYYSAQRVALAAKTNTDVRGNMLGDLTALFKDALQTVGQAR
jgi:hypothetical protein